MGTFLVFQLADSHLLTCFYPNHVQLVVNKQLTTATTFISKELLLCSYYHRITVFDDIKIGKKLKHSTQGSVGLGLSVPLIFGIE